MYKQPVEDLKERVKKLRYQDDEAIQVEARNSLNAGDIIELPASVDMYVDIGSAASNPEVLVSDESACRDVLIKINTTQGGELRNKCMRAALDLVCLVDVSGSMIGFNEDGTRGNNGKIDKLKVTLVRMLEFLTDADRFSLVFFTSKAKRATPLLNMTKGGKQQVIDLINTVEAGGSTNIFDALAMGLSILDSRRHKNQVSSIFLLSDGCDKLSLEALNKQFSTSKNYDVFSDISINTFGFGDDDCNLMELIADKTGGIFYNTEEYEDYIECFVECLGSLLSIIAEQAKMVIKLQPSSAFPEINFSKLYNEDTEKVSDLEITVTYKYLISAMSKNIVFSVNLPLSSSANQWMNKPIKVAECVLIFRSLDKTKSYEKKHDVFMTIKENITIGYNEEVQRQKMRLELSNFQKNQINLVENGRMDEAKEQERIFRERHEQLMNQKKNDAMIGSCFAQYSLTNDYMNNYNNRSKKDQECAKRKMVSNCFSMRNETLSSQNRYYCNPMQAQMVSKVYKK